MALAPKAKKAPPVNNPLKPQKAPRLARPRPRTGGGMKLPTRKVRPPRPSDTGGGMRPPKRIRPPRPSDTGGGLRPRRRPNPRRARAVAQQRNVSRRR